MPEPAPETPTTRDAPPSLAPVGRVQTARHYVLVRHRHNWVQLWKFGIVGGSGFIVNLAVYTAAVQLWDHAEDSVLSLGVNDYHVRMYHLYSMLAFFVANVSNYVLNRIWTFQSHSKHPLREYWPFLAIGLVAQGLTLLLLTVGVHLGLHVVVAQAVAIVLVVPLSFVGNKLWTFGSTRGPRALGPDDHDAAA